MPNTEDLRLMLIDHMRNMLNDPKPVDVDYGEHLLNRIIESIRVKMGEYIILYREDTPVNWLLTNTKVNGGLTKKSFATLEEAVEFAKTLSFNVVIYKGVAVSSIKHDIKVYEDE